MFINFWYAAAQSEEVQEKPVKVQMLGQDFVLFRNTEGAVKCLSNVCTHRGGSLADGIVKGDCVECPYHGWQFDGEGGCTRIPSMGKDAKIPGRARIDAYPTQERYGFVFAFLGDLPEKQRPPILDIPEYDDEGWRANHQVFDLKNDYKRSMENSLDPAHNEFVHPTHGFSGGFEDYYVPDLIVEEADWGVSFMTTYRSPPLPDRQMKTASKRSERAIIQAGSGHHGPGHTWTHIHPAEKSWMHQYSFKTPLDEANTRFFLVNMRNFLLTPEQDQRFRGRNLYIAAQDRVVLEEIRPILTPNNITNEVFVPADKVIVAYREKLKEWEGLGWRIDISKVKKNKDKVAYAIPSPARRSHKGWALDAIPLMPVAKGRKKELKKAAE